MMITIITNTGDLFTFHIWTQLSRLKRIISESLKSIQKKTITNELILFRKKII